MAKTNFQLVKIPQTSTISRILEKRGSRRHRGRPLKYPKMEKKLFDWIWKMVNRNICVSDDIIKSKASSSLNEEKSAQSENHQLQLQLSNGW